MGKLSQKKGPLASGCRVFEGAFPCLVTLSRPEPVYGALTGHDSAAKAAGLLSSKTAAEYLGISPNSIRKLVSDGKLPAYLIGEKKLVKFDRRPRQISRQMPG